MENQIRSVSYARVSTDKYSQEQSYNTQLEFFKTIAENKGEIFCEVYADKGETGTLLDNRDNFERMLYDAGIDIIKHTYNKQTITNFVASNRNSKFDKIYIKNTSRFARNTLSKQIINELKKKGVSIFFYEQNIDTIQNNSMILDFYQTFDEWESKDKSLKMRTSLQNSADKNIIRTNSRKYGYKYYPFDKNDRTGYYSNRLEIIPSEAEVVKLIFELYAAGNGMRKIEKELRKRGIKTRENKYFGKSSIGRILDDEKYCGQNPIYKWSGGYVFEKHPIRKNTDYNVKDNEKIDAIISVELFNKCRDLRSKNTSGKTGKTTNTSIFYKRIKCSECGSNYNRDNYDGIKVYRCPQRKFRGVEACSNHYVYENDCINFVNDRDNIKAVIEHINKKIQTTNLKIEKNKYLISMRDDEENFKIFEEAQKRSISDELEEHTRTLAALFTRLRTHQISQEEHDILMADTTKKIKELNEELSNLRYNNFKTIQNIENDIIERDILKTSLSKIKKNNAYISQHIHIIVHNGNLQINMEDTIQSIIHDAFN